MAWPRGTVDTYASAADPQAVNYTVTGLTRGLHTLSIGVTGTKNAASSEAWVWVDAFNVIPDPMAGTCHADRHVPAIFIHSAE